MDISVIIVNYNTFSYTNQAVKSVLEALDYGNLKGEIFIVDNNSKDSSGNALEEAFSGEDRVKVIKSNKNLGFSGGNNLALDKCSGDNILLLNSDTIIEPDSLDKGLKFLNLNPQISLLGPKVKLADKSLDPACKRSFPTPLSAMYHFLKLDKLFKKSKHFGSYNLTYLDENLAHEVESISGCFMLMPRETYEKIGNLSEDYFMYGEDLDYCYQIKREGGQIVYFPLMEITHFKKKSWNGKKNPKVLDAFYDSMLIFYDKYNREKNSKITNFLVKNGIKGLKKAAKLKNNLKKE